jgi:hypothetical protein
MKNDPPDEFADTREGSRVLLLSLGICWVRVEWSKNTRYTFAQSDMTSTMASIFSRFIDSHLLMGMIPGQYRVFFAKDLKI